MHSPEVKTRKCLTMHTDSELVVVDLSLGMSKILVWSVAWLHQLMNLAEGHEQIADGKSA